MNASADALCESTADHTEIRFALAAGASLP
jgi:hypothetical protein